MCLSLGMMTMTEQSSEGETSALLLLFLRLAGRRGNIFIILGILPPSRTKNNHHFLFSPPLGVHTHTSVGSPLSAASVFSVASSCAVCMACIINECQAAQVNSIWRQLGSMMTFGCNEPQRRKERSWTRFTQRY